MAGAVIGADCNIGDHTFIEDGATIGNGVTVKNGVAVWRGVSVGDDAFVGPSVTFTNDLRPRAHRKVPQDELVPTLIERGVTLGANATVLCGIRVGLHALVGAGAVVTKDVEDHALVVGSPARRVGWVCECGERLGDALICASCTRAYEASPTGLAPRP